MRKAKWEEFANEYVVSLFPVFMLPAGCYLGSKKLFGLPAEISFKIENRAVTWYSHPENWGKAHLRLVEKIKRDPEFLTMIYREMLVRGRAQVSFARQAASASARADNSKLFGLYEHFCRMNVETYKYGLMLPLLDYQDQTFLTDELTRILRSRKAEKLFNFLTIPVTPSLVKQQELGLLRLAGQIQRRNALRNMLIRASAAEALDLLRIKALPIYRSLQGHSRKFAAAYYVYEGPAATLEYFVELLQDILKRRFDPGKSIKLFQRESREVPARQRAFYKRLGLNKYERRIAELARDGVYVKAVRRELQSKSYYLLEPVQREIGRRLGLSLSQVRQMLPAEVERGLISGKVQTEELNRRSRLLFYHFLGGKGRIFSDDAARVYISKNCLQHKVDKAVKVFSGAVAYPGKVKGKVKVINAPDEMSKMKPGDILVAQTTNPNLMPAIRQAAAIVTDEGGLTCHAAIVSRELKIPCVVGTKFASKVLHDGDMVEVDASKGIVKKISKN